ncbi:Serrate RNA effector molecule homolog A,Serrate RNA effector molecule homolog B,Serrate RNA effector molecule homolog [Mytilus edulis]|uniref:Serrate RNA effector molecule homolog A,Serrate RNA effector molecule homolog B,Serrate RNA effector molecule homolog n=1 Tax=Mytilus edulis TaxID=6550 RepID=A0A8S3QLK5_MYTED|nr:Serrate RNA effector molecule homolog A,Serrate RNA effector molecule homolog B,Serrate RNA effector molecule homolog [Mytilus edulis]
MLYLFEILSDKFFLRWAIVMMSTIDVKGRDKFRRERNDYERRDDRRRDPRAWEHDRSNRSSWGGSRDRRDPYREYDTHRRDRAYSPPRRDMSPPHAKRMRRDTWDEGSAYPGYSYNGPPSGGASGNGPPLPDPDGHPGQNREEMLTQPAMMTFKAFLQSLPDNISDQDAIKKFNEYKADFKKQQINEFFLAHKEEEWFKTKYHPEECAKRKEEVRKALRKRCEVFMEFLESGRVATVACDIERNEELVKLLDAVVIKLEGGSDFDLSVLDQPEPEEQGSRSRNNSESVSLDQRLVMLKRKREEAEKKPDEPLKLPITAEQKELMKKAQEFSKQQQAKNGSQDGKKAKKKKRNRDKTEYSYESGSDSESESCSDTDSEPAPPGMEDEPPPPGTEISEDSNNIPGVSSTDDVTAKPKEEGKSLDEKEVDTTQKDEDTNPKPKALHKTCSIFLRNLAPSITKQEVEAMCKRYPGFVRVALQDPQPERRFFRRGWVTFERDVNIKEICWNLNNIRLRDCELGATLNRELKQRVRPVNGITAHKQIVQSDIKLAAKIMQNLDTKWRMWEEDPEEKKDDTKDVPCDMVQIRNPILKNVTDFLIDEGDFEEEELLGQSKNEGEGDTKTDEIKMERDEAMCKALDSMVLYLRIVHSIDFYSCNEYPNEDEMPHRCGIMHARCVPPTTKITQNDINEWIKNFETKIKALSEHDSLPDDEVVKLGKKDPEAEVEKFVTANTQELAKDKWLCPMSGKKFKGPEFVRKHIQNKHGEKVEEVKMEVSFFNKYLMDPKRPALPEHPGNKQSSNNRNSTGGDQFTSPSGYQGGGMPPMGYSGGGNDGWRYRGGGGSGGPPSYQSPSYRNREPYRGPYRGSGGGGGGYNRGYRSNRHRHNQSDPRRVIEYRDLDAPDDSDIF